MMNPSSWCNPPPPGIEVDEESKHSNVSSAKSYSGLVLDQIDPYIKNPEYVKYKQSSHHRRSPNATSIEKYRSRSRSKERRRKHRSRSRSRGRHRRSRSRSRRHRRFSHSSSHSRSRSGSQSRHRYKHKKKKSRRSRSRSRSHERRRYERKYYKDASLRNNEIKEEDDDPDAKENAFKNDGSFLEMFKKMQEEKEKAAAVKTEIVAAPVASCSEVKKPLPAFGKRRGGRVLKTGMVEKTKAAEDDELANATDPWSIYLKEVKRYKEACCDDDSKTRPLVK